jgi:hypothetical protein
MAIFLDNYSEEELVFLAATIALALAEPITDDDALQLASFISTISSNMVLFAARRGKVALPEPPAR